jgi:precorrin-6B methylase 2
MPREWTGEALLEMGRSYQPACVLLAAAELDVFGALAREPMTAAQLAAAVRGEPRATGILADALTALGFLEKDDGVYSPAPEAAGTLTSGGSASVLPMLHHHANCLRRWVQLAAVVRSGRPVERKASVRGSDADLEAFIEAMEVACRDVAAGVVASVAPPSFDHLLDVGGGPATWTIAFLRLIPAARATLFDLPDVIPMARRHVEAAGMADRVSFVGGDFTADEPLPAGADLAWVSAIVHQNSRRQNRELFAKVHAALVPGGRIMIRDIVMDDAHTSPPGGAMFAINMLVATEGGGTFSFAELSEDLHDTGFGDPDLVRGERDMDSVVRARRL